MRRRSVAFANRRSARAGREGEGERAARESERERKRAREKESERERERERKKAHEREKKTEKKSALICDSAPYLSVLPKKTENPTFSFSSRMRGLEATT